MKENKPLSNFLQKKLQQFDHEEQPWERPSSATRNKILSDATNHSSKGFIGTRWSKWIIAAALIFFAGISLYLFMQHNINAYKQQLAHAIESQISLENELNALKLSNQEQITKIKSQQIELNNVKKALNQQLLMDAPTWINSNNKAVLVARKTPTKSSISSQTPTIKNTLFENVATQTAPVVLSSTTVYPIDMLSKYPMNTFDLMEPNLEIDPLNNMVLATLDHKSRDEKSPTYSVGGFIHLKKPQFKTKRSFSNNNAQEVISKAKITPLPSLGIEGLYHINKTFSIGMGIANSKSIIHHFSHFNLNYNPDNTVTDSKGDLFNEIAYRTESSVGNTGNSVEFKVPKGLKKNQPFKLKIHDKYNVINWQFPVFAQVEKKQNSFSFFTRIGLQYNATQFQHYKFEADIVFEKKPFQKLSEKPKTRLEIEKEASYAHSVAAIAGIGLKYHFNTQWSIQGNIDYQKNIISNENLLSKSLGGTSFNLGLFYSI